MASATASAICCWPGRTSPPPGSAPTTRPRAAATSTSGTSARVPAGLRQAVRSCACGSSPNPSRGPPTTSSWPWPGCGREAGFDAFFRSDHYLAMGGDGLPGPTDSWITLAGLARDTNRIRLGTLVTSATFRLPGPLAITVAQVDAMSGGRVELGLGAGWYDAEHHAYGIPFPPLGERFERLEEQLSIMTGLWQTPAGRALLLRRAATTSCDDSPALPKPVQSPRPPDHRRRRRPQADAAAGRPLRRRVQRAVPSPPETADARTGGSGRRARPAAATPATLRCSAAVTTVCGADEAEVARRAAAIGREVAELQGQRGVRHAGRGRRPARASGPTPAPSAMYLQVLDLADLDHVRLLGARGPAAR